MQALLSSIDISGEGEDVFGEHRSIVLRSPRIRRTCDEESRILMHFAHARELADGSARAVPLHVPES